MKVLTKPRANPLYEQIKNAIERRILDGVWTPQFRLPPEDELATEFGASPLTVRRALRELQTEGLVTRIQGRGTFVVGPRMQCAIFELHDIAEEIEEGGGIHSSEVLTLEAIPAGDPQTRLLAADLPDRVFHSRIVHYEDGTPIQLEERFVNAAQAPHYLAQDFRSMTTYGYLLRETKVTSVQNTIRAIRPDEAACAALRIDGSQPCLLLDRRTWCGPVPVTRSRYLYPGDRYRLRSFHQADLGRGVADQF